MVLEFQVKDGRIFYKGYSLEIVEWRLYNFAIEIDNFGNIYQIKEERVKRWTELNQLKPTESVEKRKKYVGQLSGDGSYTISKNNDRFALKK